MNTSTLPLPDYPCYLNGEFTPLAKAQVSVLDRGFLFGDGVYEVVPVYGGRPFRALDHLDRLTQSLAEADIPNPHSREQWLRLIGQVVVLCTERTGQADHLVYLQVTRGVAPERSWEPPSNLSPTVFIMATPHQPPAAELRRHGVSAVTARDLRWSRCTLKSTSLLGSVLARQQAIEADAAEVIMIHNDHLTEGSSSNVWIVFEDALLTPPPGEHVLDGVRLRVVRELCEELGLACNQRPIPEFELRAASEIMLSSAGRELLPVTRLDGELVGHGAGRGRPGPVFGRLYEAYQAAKRLG